MADQTPLDRAKIVNTLPEGDQRNRYSAVFDAFQNAYGRAPSQDELNQALPAFIDPANPHITNTASGNALVSQMHTATDNTPDKLYAKQQSEYAANAPKFSDQINNLFQSNYGRAATQDELTHFGSLLASGTQDSYQLQNFLQQQPEYQNKQNAQMRTDLSSTMAANDKRQFSEQILPSIQEAYAKQGRSFDSSAFQNAATQSAQAQNTNRESFLSNLTAQQYGGVQQNAYNDYANQVAQQQNLTNSGIQAQYSGIQNTINRSNNISDYNTQAQAYNQYLAKYGKRNNGVGQLVGGAVGGAAGAYFGGPAGATAGYQLGSGLGGAAQNSMGGSY